MKTVILIKLYLMGICILFTTVAQAQDAISAAQDIAEKVESQFYNREFQAINKQEYKYRTAQSRLLDGRWKLTFIYAKLGDVSKRGAEDEWKLKLQLVDEWIKETPDNPTPYLAKGDILIAYAWDARGRGWASTVTPERWQIFFKRISDARKVLDTSVKISGNNPYWFLEMERIANVQDWTEEKFDRLYKAAVKAFPTYYFNYFRAADYYLPRWHGSRKNLRQFVEKAVENSKQYEGMTLYTRIYWSQLWALKDNTFDLGYAEWDKMQTGFKDIQKQYPKSLWNLNAYAYYACMAKDWPTTDRLINKIGKEPHPAIWQSKARYYSCKATAEKELKKKPNLPSSAKGANLADTEKVGLTSKISG